MSAGRSAGIVDPALRPPDPPHGPLLAEMIGYALHRTGLDNGVLYVVAFGALLLLQRMKNRHSPRDSGHRLFMAAHILVHKFLCDDSFSNRSWCSVAGDRYTVQDVNKMERDMCGLLDWQLGFALEDVVRFERAIRKEFNASLGFSASSIEACISPPFTSSTSPASSTVPFPPAPVGLSLPAWIPRIVPTSMSHGWTDRVVFRHPPTYVAVYPLHSEATSFNVVFVPVYPHPSAFWYTLAGG